MFQIGDNTLVSLDLAERFFCCDLEACRGACCIDGDSGAPITAEESAQLESIVKEINPLLIDDARKRIREAGVSYVDEEGDLVTQLVGGRNCVFASRGDESPCKICLCTVEQAWRDGLQKVLRKPSSCALYPLRITEYPSFTAVNYHRWGICAPAEKLGRAKNIRLFEFLEGPLTERFGAEWYAELAAACRLYLEENPSR